MRGQVIAVARLSGRIAARSERMIRSPDRSAVSILPRGQDGSGERIRMAVNRAGGTPRSVGLKEATVAPGIDVSLPSAKDYMKKLAAAEFEESKRQARKDAQAA